MKEKSILIGCYATLILIGGVIGYVVAHSLISLIASGLFSILLLACTVQVWRGRSGAYDMAMILIAFLLAFFCYRWILTQKMMPAGMMSLMSGGLLIYLAIARKQRLQTKYEG